MSVSDKPKVPHTLLLADDSVTIQRVVELTFADEDVQVVAVSDGDQAIARIQASPPDIILADIGMPGKNGYDVAQYVRESPKYAHIPVVLLTGAFEPVDRARAGSVGCEDVLAKPFEPQLVIGRVKDLLAKSQTAVAAGRGSTSAAEQPRAPEPPEHRADPPGAKFVERSAEEILNQAFGFTSAPFTPSPASAPAPLNPAASPQPFAALHQAEPSQHATASQQAAPPQETETPTEAAPAVESHSSAVADLNNYFDRLDEALSTLKTGVPPASSVLAEPEASGGIDWFGTVETARPAAPPEEWDEPSAPEPAPPDLPLSYGSAEAALPVPQSAPAPQADVAPGPAPSPAPSAPPESAAAAAPPPVVPNPVPPSIVDAFAALLDAEQRGEAPAAPQPWPSSAPPAISDDVIEEVAQRVLGRLSDRVVRETVSDLVSAIAERLVREEIARIKAALNT